MPRPETDAAIRKGLGFLARTQQKDGGFISYSSASMRQFRRAGSWRTVFVPALMLASLAGLDDREAAPVREKLAGFLLEQKSAGWSFNYWAKDSTDRKTQPYPDDLDDTFCALAGLYLHDPSIVDEAVMARAVKLLLAAEASVGGPYRTWLVPSGSRAPWLDVDPAVNANIAYFLSLIGSRLPNLDKMMGKSITAEGFSSPYYPSRYAFIYYFARAYEGPHKGRLLDLARRFHRQAATDLDRALCISARVRLGGTEDLGAAASELLTGQQRGGAWPGAAFYADPVKKGKLYYSGAPALTTAFALEALDLYRRAAGHKTAGSARASDITVKKDVLALAGRQCRGLPEELRRTVLELLGKLAAGSNGPEIIGLARRFNGSLIEPLKPAPKGLLDELGLANLYGWLAYTVYDDFLDEEGKPGLLPAANTAMRKSLAGFSEALPGHQAWQHMVRGTFDAIDGANAWEQANCRFELRSGRLVAGRLPDYANMSKLAERSLGHALPPMAVLAAKGLDLDGAACGHVMTALRHYLIARQLNDDAHDWSDDLNSGHITAVVALILSELGIKPGTYDAAKISADARHRFWHHTLGTVCRLAKRHIRMSRRSFSASRLIRPGSGMGGLLDRLETSVDETLAMRGQAEAFLKQYKRKPAGAAAKR
jgi:hypothetical protein